MPPAPAKNASRRESGLRWMNLALLVPIGSRGPGRGAALSDRLVSLRTLCPVRAPGPAAQTAARAGPRADWSNAPVAARPRAHRGGRQQLRRPGVVGLVRAAGSARDGNHPLALGCRPLPAGPGAPARPKRPAAAQRRTDQEAHRTAQGRPHPLADLPAALVRRRGPSAAVGHRHGRVVSRGQTAGGHPVGAGARFQKTLRTPSVALHRPDAVGPPNRAILRPALSRWRPRFRKPAFTWAWKASANGMTWPP